MNISVLYTENFGVESTTTATCLLRQMLAWYLEVVNSHFHFGVHNHLFILCCTV